MRFKVMSNLVTSRPAWPQDGNHHLRSGTRRRAGCAFPFSPRRAARKSSCACLIRRTGRFDLNTLGFDDSTQQGLLRLLKTDERPASVHRPHRLGQTSTMYSALCYIMQRDGINMSISTVEDPVEFNLAMVSQTQVHPTQEFTYAVALKSILRQGPAGRHGGRNSRRGDSRHRRAKPG